MNKILLYSGGMDSYIAWCFLNHPKSIYIPLGHRYEKTERQAIIETIPETFMAPCCDVGAMESADAHIPGRNLLLASLAALWEPTADEVVLVCQRDEMTLPDRSDGFFNQSSAVLSLVMDRPLMVTTPFADMDKTDMVGWYVSQGLPIDLLLKTRSCYAGTDLPCGECGACLRRFIALRLNGLMESYATDPRATRLADDYRDRVAKGLYSIHRSNRIRAILGEKTSDLLPMDHGSQERHSQ